MGDCRTPNLGRRFNDERITGFVIYTGQKAFGPSYIEWSRRRRQKMEDFIRTRLYLRCLAHQDVAAVIQQASHAYFE